MKTTQRILGYILLCIGGLCACQKPGLEQALEAAGDNRKELEAVLEHYKDDPQKLQAARFLIENMDAHYFFEGEAVTAYYRYMDSVFRNCEGDRPYWNRQYDTILQRVGKDLETCMAEPRFDIEEIKAEYLIANIDSAFAVYHQNWNKQYGFDIFLRYVLPYPLGNEQVSDWRTELALPAGERKAYAENTFNANYVYGIAHDVFLGMQPWIYYPRQFLPDFPLKQLKHIKLGVCKEYAHLCAATFRAQGIPATVDFTPQWGNRSLGHEWCVFFPNDRTAIPFEMGQPVGCHFMKRKEDRIPKVFRQTFEKQENSLYMLNKGREPLPLVFSTPCIVDVTREYIETSDVEVDLYLEKYDTRYVYLAIFDNQNWSVVHWAIKEDGKARFTDLGRDIVYLPVYYINDEVIPAGDAFFLDNEGKKILLVPDTKQKITVKAKRKFRDVKAKSFLQGVIGGVFQGANRPDFSDAVNLYEIPHIEDNQFHKVAIVPQGRFKYFRYCAPDGTRGNMAELYCLDGKGDTLKPIRWHESANAMSDCGIEKLTDGDVLTYYESQQTDSVWFGWEYRKPVGIAQILYLPRNDDNFIREGEDYELFYWNRGKWASLGKQRGNFAAELHFPNAPANALFLLHNHTKGTEERIFMYEKGKQIWR